MKTQDEKVTDLLSHVESFVCFSSILIINMIRSNRHNIRKVQKNQIILLTLLLSRVDKSSVKHNWYGDIPSIMLFFLLFCMSFSTAKSLFSCSAFEVTGSSSSSILADRLLEELSKFGLIFIMNLI